MASYFVESVSNTATPKFSLGHERTFHWASTTATEKNIRLFYGLKTRKCFWYVKILITFIALKSNCFPVPKKCIAYQNTPTGVDQIIAIAPDVVKFQDSCGQAKDLAVPVVHVSVRHAHEPISSTRCVSIIEPRQISMGDTELLVDNFVLTFLQFAGEIHSGSVETHSALKYMEIRVIRMFRLSSRQP